MQIKDLEAKKQLHVVGIGLTSTEARELRAVLDMLIENGGDRHEHVASADYQTELTVWISEQQAP